MNDNLVVVKEFSWDSSHILPGYEGPCGRLHGHTYRLQVGVGGELGWRESKQSADHMVVDFKDLKLIVETHIKAPLDHYHLNEVKSPIYAPGFPWDYPTAERMVLWIRNRLQEFFPGLAFVRLWETPTSFCEWHQEGR